MINLYKVKIRLQHYLPEFISDYIIYAWRKPLSCIRLWIYKKRGTKKIKPYFKTISFGQLEVDMYVDVTESWVSREVDIRGIHEEHILEKIINHLPKDGVFVDVGANVGQHSLFAAKKVGIGGIVFAFEPIPSSANNLRFSIEKNSLSNLNIIEKAVTSSVGEVSFFKYGLSDISSRSENFTDRPSEKITVITTTLDDELSNQSRIDLIKIDVEGYEMDVLRGAREIIKKHHPVVILEFSPIFYNKSNPEDSMSILNFFEALGYSITDIDNQMCSVHDFKDYCNTITTSGGISNIMCIYGK